MIRAVCKTWNSEWPKHVPILVLPFEGVNDLSVPHLRMPWLESTVIRGSCFGWLISVGIDGILQVSNPYQISLKSSSNFNLPTREYVLRDPRLRKTTRIPIITMQRRFVQKIIFTCSPDHSKEFMAVAMYSECTKLAFCRSGDAKWTDIKSIDIWCKYEDIIYHDGKLYVIDDRCCLHEFDMKTKHGGRSTTVSLPHGHNLNDTCNKKYLAVNPNGDLLLLVRHFDFSSHGHLAQGSNQLQDL
ncbi:hypothetical protein RJT34_06160 [Clitoria ternatea]|uniref:KIB1-4 beta-propeller domain-containing protein n=1 Tax=Clitoria ternatea TaxID=43366 RepID=A0AAN9K1X7_CLITE